ncbi:TPA: alpha/beta hydrolase [Candidatus Woesearchaeota archaeon]|nr:alpha/beta hydrolase [Candidatus Woesearchaeota archaeon]HIH13112.1 alpha/beta hydrolase [Candidatus Woesearchaeota archaeon]
MRQIVSSFDGTRIYSLHHRGENPLTLVFLHGVGANWTVWKREIEYFQRRGYSTLTLDLRGHGLSGAPEDFKRYKVPYFSRDVYNLLKVQGVQNFCLLGHSLGGAIAINYCMLYKKKYPDSLVLVESASTYPFRHNRLLNFGPHVTRFLRYLANYKFSRRATALLQHLSQVQDVDLSVEGVKAEFHMLSHLMSLTPLQSIVKTLDNMEEYVHKNQKLIYETVQHLGVPTLILAGERDDVVPLRYSQHLKKLNRRAELKIIKGARHKAIIWNADEISPLIEEFIRKNKK